MAVCVHAKSLQSCPTLCDPVDCSLPGFPVHGILQARILEWAAVPSSRGSSPPRDQTQVSSACCTSGQILYHGAPKEAQMVRTVDCFLCFTTIENHFKRKENEGPHLVTGTRRSRRGFTVNSVWLVREVDGSREREGCKARIV